MTPILETPRSILRPHKIEDFDVLFDIWAHPTTYRYISGKPSTRQQTWARFLTCKGLWTTLGYGYWAIEEKDTGKFVGEIGFGNFKRDMEPPLANIPEAGWIIHPDFHGKGYAEETVRCALEWLDTKTSQDQSCCIIDPQNDSSIKLAGKVGFVPDGNGIYMETEVLKFSRRK